MFTNRVRQAIAATLQGLPLSATVEEFTPPKIEFDMESMSGGRFIAEEMAKSGKVLNAKLILLLANQVGDARVLSECIEAAREIPTPAAE